MKLAGDVLLLDLAHGVIEVGGSHGKDLINIFSEAVGLGGSVGEGEVGGIGGLAPCLKREGAGSFFCGGAG